MGRAVPIVVRLPAAVTIGIFIVVHQLTTFPFGALATLPSHFSDVGHHPEDVLMVTGEDVHRYQFPPDFIFGTGTSAYQLRNPYGDMERVRAKGLNTAISVMLDLSRNQVEGAAWEGGKGPSIWDTWAHTPGKVQHGDTGDVAVDGYHRYEEDFEFLAAMNMDSYRFSIAWTRIFPNGTGPGVNKEGVAHYNRVIDALVTRGITPLVTLYHWDLPQALQDLYGGWFSNLIVGDFAAYAEACFAAFGDRVKNWVTFNEPQMFLHGYAGNRSPPGRSSNPSTEPYIAAHNVLLAHAAATDVYKRLFKAEQNGVIGITVDCSWGEPLTDSSADISAAKRYVIFQMGWFLDPLFFGDYPEVMRENVENRLPRFSKEQARQLRGSLDFIGLNHYTSFWVTQGPGPLPNQESNPSLDQHVAVTTSKDGIEIGPNSAASSWVRRVPWGFYKLLKYISKRYDAPIIVTENGMYSNDDLPLEDSLHDKGRIQYYREYLSAVLQALREGVDVRGYFAWSLLDNFEWGDGYNLRFGLVYVDHNDGLKRYAKDSARWFSQFLDRKVSTS